MSLKLYNRLSSFLRYHSLLFLFYIVWTHYLGKINFDYIKVVAILMAYWLSGIGAYLVNDFFDLKQDQISKKINLAENQSVLKIFSFIILLWTCSFIILSIFSFTAAILLGVQFILLLLYSVPIVRLKERALLGIITDASYAYILPLIILFEFFNVSIDSISVIILLIFNLAIGVRDILIHQQKDKINDVKSGTKTYTTNHKEIHINTLLQVAQFYAIISLTLFLGLNLTFKSQLLLVILNLCSGALLIILSIIYFRKSLANNYIIRYFVLFSILYLNIHFIKLDTYFGLLLLLHPYFLNFLVQFKNFNSYLINSILVFIFKQFGRDLKKNPLYTKKNDKN